MMSNLSILIVDDEAYIINSILRLLRPEGYNILTARDCAEALDIAGKNRIDLLISDYKMPQMTGVELINHIRHFSPHTKCAILTGYADNKETSDAIVKGDIDIVIEKPWQNDEFKTIIKELLKTKENKTNGR